MVPTGHSDVVTESGRTFWGGATGRWAGEQMIKQIKLGRDFSAKALRQCDTLSRDQWKAFDTVLVREASIRLRGVADLIAAGLVRTIPNGIAKTVLEYQKVTDIDPAIVSLDGVTRSENDQATFSTAGIPLPITHKDFYINLRALAASRTSGEPLDTTMIAAAGRKIAEETEKMLFQGSTKVFGALPIYGYTTHPSRNLLSFSATAWNVGSTTGAQIHADLSAAIALLEGDRMYGPYGIYVGAGMSTKLSEDYKAATMGTIRQRLLDIENVSFIRVSDQMPASQVVVVQLTSDVVQMVSGEPLQTVQWDFAGGFQINFKAWQIMVPLVKADASGRSGIVHMS